MSKVKRSGIPSEVGKGLEGWSSNWSEIERPANAAAAVQSRCGRFERKMKIRLKYTTSVFNCHLQSTDEFYLMGKRMIPSRNSHWV